MKRPGSKRGKTAHGTGDFVSFFRALQPKNRPLQGTNETEAKYFLTEQIYAIKE